MHIHFLKTYTAVHVENKGLEVVFEPKCTLCTLFSYTPIYIEIYYVTSHKDARSKIRSLERDELLEELVRAYLEKKE